MTIGDIPVHQVRLVHIKSTLHLSKLSVSQGFEAEVSANDKLRRLDEWMEMALGKDGNIMSPFDS